jgi:hypothetical protein
MTSQQKDGRGEDEPRRAAGQPAPRDVVVALLRADAPGEVMGAPEDWPRWAVLLPHVLAAAGDVSDAELAGPAAGTADDVAWLLDRAATYLQVHARLTEARRWPNGPWPSPKPPTAPTTPTSAPT